MVSLVIACFFICRYGFSVLVFFVCVAAATATNQVKKIFKYLSVLLVKQEIIHYLAMQDMEKWGY